MGVPSKRPALHRVSPALCSVALEDAALNCGDFSTKDEKLSIIKWDVEGFEYDIFRDVLSEGSGLHTRLPREMLFELHYRSHMGARTAWWDREKTAGEVAMLAVDLYDAGYRVIGAHINGGCSSCYEYTLLRVTCPEKPHAQ